MMRPPPGSATAALGALLCAGGVALAAYASHGAGPEQASRLGLAAAFAFAHGLALIVLSPRRTALAALVRLLIVLGVAGFSGGLCVAAFRGTTAPTAPIGGSLLILAWLLAALDLWRRGDRR
jgi:uncharacterized membrane protein YgdD (TMEM256/DUF423 family)